MPSKLKQMAALAVATVVAAGLTACGDSSEGGTRSPADQVTDLYRSMQDDFREGRGNAFCKAFGTANRSLDEFGGETVAIRVATCASTVADVARKVDSGEVTWPSYTIGRVGFPSPDVAYLELRDGEGFLNLQFTKRDGRWNADFSVPDELEGMNAE